jgi:ribosome-associated toxin RatA of RatAB toxin-antitoxin module
MALITQKQVIDAPIDRVFDTVIDVGNYAAWNPTITASRRLAGC